MVGESRRLSPTAASVAAPDLGPLVWPASSLRRSSHGRAGSRYTAGRAAPPVRVSGASPGLSADCKLQRTGRSTDRFFTDPDQDRTRLPPDCPKSLYDEDLDHDRLGPRPRRPRLPPDCPKSLLSDQALLVPFYSSCAPPLSSRCAVGGRNIPPEKLGWGCFPTVKLVYQRNWGGS